MTPLLARNYPPTAFEWMPSQMRAVRDPKATGCRCHGTGSLGELIAEAGKNLEAKRVIPCPCLHFEIPEELQPLAAIEIEKHYDEVKATGQLCPCLFCMTRRKLEAQA